MAQKGALQKLGKGEGQVDIVAWAGYIERGATSKDFDWVVSAFDINREIEIPLRRFA